MKRTTTKTTRKTNKTRRMVALLVAAALCVTLVAGFAASGFAMEAGSPAATGGEAGAQMGENGNTGGAGGGQDPSADPQGGPAQDDNEGGAAGTPGPSGHPLIQGGGAGQDDTGGGALDGNGVGAAGTPGPSGYPLNQGGVDGEGAEPGMRFAEVSRVGYTDPAAEKFYTDTEDNAPLKIAVDFAVAEGEGKIAPLTVQVQNQGENYFKLPEANPESVCSVPAEVKSVPRVDGSGQPVLDGKGNQLFDIEVTFTPEGSGRAELAIPYDQGNEPDEGTKLAQVWAGGVPFEVFSGLLEKPIKAQAGEPVEITNVPASLALQTTKAGRTITLTGTYRINDADGGAGGKITVTLENTFRNFFLLPTADDVKSPAIASGELKVNDPYSPDGGKTLVIELDVLGGTQYSSANFTVNYTLDYTNPDVAGWAAKDDTVANITVTGEKGAGAVSQKSTPVTNSFNNSDRYVSFNKSPVGDTPVDTANLVDLSLGYPNTSSGVGYWNYQPGTDVTMTLYYPAGAEVEDAKGGTVDEDAGTITWLLATAGADGAIPTDAAIISRKGVAISFPSEDGDSGPLFAPGDEVEMKAEIRYTLAGAIPSPVVLTKPIAFKIEKPYVHMKENKFTYSGAQWVNIDSPASATAGNTFNGAMINDGTAPIPEACVTWQNDPDGTGKKANLYRMHLYQLGVTFRTKLVFYIYDDATGQPVRIQEAMMGAAGSPGGSGAYYFSSLGLTAGQYIEKMEIFPQDGEKNALPFGASMNINLQCFSWSCKNADGQYAFPNGTAIQDGDQAFADFTLSWKGESDTASHTEPTYRYDGDTEISSISLEKAQTVYYFHNRPKPTLWYTDTPTGALMPGDTFGATLNFVNDSYSSDYVPNSVWKDPVLLVAPPDNLEMLAEVGDTFAWTKNGAAQGTVTLSEVTTKNGRPLYKFTLPAGTQIGTSNRYTAPFNQIQLQFKVKPGALAGTYYLSAENLARSLDRTISGLTFGTSADAADRLLPYPADAAPGNTWYPDTDTDWDDCGDTPYLRQAGFTRSYTINSAQKLDVDARLWNGEAGEWQGVSGSGAQATVPLGGTGKFRLELKNGGTTYAGAITLLDILPQVGDRSAMNTGNATTASGGDTTEKGSNWNATLQSLKFTVYKADGTALTAEETAAQFPNMKVELCTNGNPVYSSGGINRKGTSATFSTGVNSAAAKSFRFTSGTDKLPPGWKIVFEGTLSAPSEMSGGDIGSAAYNSFAIGATYYATQAATSGTLYPTSEPTKQKFVIADANTGKITNTGVVWADWNGNGAKDAGEPPMTGVTVELYLDDEDNPGHPQAEPMDSTTTGADGKYTFTGLSGGKYYTKVVLPTAPTHPADAAAGYAFVAAGTDSQVDANGFSPMMTLSAGGTQNVNFNAGVKAAGAVRVAFKTADGTVVSTMPDMAVGSYASGTATGTVTAVQGTAGAGQVSIPADYRLVSTQAAAQDWTLYFAASGQGDKLYQEIVYTVELDNYTVTFDKNTADAVTGMPAAQTVAHNGKATDPGAALTRAGYTWDGTWYKEAACTNVWNFTSDTVAKDVTLYAKWTANPPATFTVTFDKNTADAVTGTPAPQTVQSGKTASDPKATLTREGYTTDGKWYKDKAGTNEWNFASDTVTKDVTLYAKWTANPPVAKYFTVTFDKNTADAVTGMPAAQTVQEGKAANDPKASLTREGYTTDGKWYKDKAGTQAWDFAGDKVTANVTLYAKWTAEEKETPPPTPPTDNVFRKMPMNTEVRPGEAVDYVIDGFGNTSARDYTGFAVMDIVPEGLTFVSMRIPAFAKGAGLTYDVVYATDGGARTVLERGVSAAGAHTVAAPAVAGGERVAEIGIEIASVPAGFGVGDSITATFRVDANPPAKELVNRAMLYFKNGAQENTIPNGGETTITVIGENDTPAGGLAGEVTRGDEAAGGETRVARTVGGIPVGPEDITMRPDGTPLRPGEIAANWSLLSLIFAIIGAALAVATAAAVSRKKKDGEDEFYARDEERESKKRGRNIFTGIVAAIAAMAGAAVLLLFNDFAATMVWVNNSTPLIAVMAVIAGIAMGFGIKFKKDAEKEEDENASGRV